MNNNGNQLVRIDLVRFEQNRQMIPQEALQSFAGQHVAFNRDGTRVMAHGSEYESVFAQLEKLGIRVGEVIFDYIPGPDEDTWL